MLAYVDFESSPVFVEPFFKEHRHRCRIVILGERLPVGAIVVVSPSQLRVWHKKQIVKRAAGEVVQLSSLQVRCIRRSDASHEILHQVVIARVSPSLKIGTGYPENVRNILVAITEKSAKGAHFAIPVGTG